RKVGKLLASPPQGTLRSRFWNNDECCARCAGVKLPQEYDALLFQNGRPTSGAKFGFTARGHRHLLRPPAGYLPAGSS
nr:hypothetical protein [Tanacetum cinerariifolium]